MGGMPGVMGSTISPPQVSGTPPAIMLPGTPALGTSSSNYSGNSMAKGPIPMAVGIVGSGMGASSSLTSTPQPSQPVGGNASTNIQPQRKDPFADLAGLF
jgi:hypothetical protein